MVKNEATKRSIQWAKDNPEQYKLNQKKYRDNRSQNMTDEEKEEERKKRNERSNKWRKEHPDEVRERKRLYVNKRRSLDGEYRDLLNRRVSNWRDRNKEYVKKYAKQRYDMYYPSHKEMFALRSKENRTNKRLEVIYWYSDGTMKCKVCDKDDYEVLSIDHINGGGNIHRKCGELKRYSNDIVNYLVAMGFPKGYQILCHNCNTIKFMDSIVLKNPNAAYNKYREKLKLTIINKYSQGTMKCGNCDEDRIDCLTIDHINGGGTKHRKKIGGFYQWLKNNKYPDGFRVLCMNCNKKFGYYGGI